MQIAFIDSNNKQYSLFLLFFLILFSRLFSLAPRGQPSPVSLHPLRSFRQQFHFLPLLFLFLADQLLHVIELAFFAHTLLPFRLKLVLLMILLIIHLLCITKLINVSAQFVIVLAKCFCVGSISNFESSCQLLLF